MKSINLKEIFADDPEVLQALEAKEQTALLKELVKQNVVAEKEAPKVTDVKIEFLKGEKGNTPVKGVDYFTKEDMISVGQTILDEFDIKTPVKGEDYFTEEEIKDFKKSVTPKKGKDYRDGIDGEKGEKGNDGSPDTPEQVVEKINKSKTKIKSEQIEGYENIDIEKIAKEFKIGGKHQLALRDIKGARLDMNDQRWHGGGLTNITGYITAGSNIIITGTGTSTDPYNINATGGGSGFTELTATGLVNSSNLDFTFITKPTYIVSDGVWFKEFDNNSVAFWTWNAGTLTATMVNPPAQSIWGVA